MQEWNIEYTDVFERSLKWYQKKHPYELTAVLNNLDTYLETLKMVGNPLQIKAEFIHAEPEGVMALDQKGGKQTVKLKQTRLYVFPFVESKILYVFCIGDKQSQREDIKYCQSTVKKIKRGDYE